jgi:4-diphosphocytidyl-2-C-methyl-D-erythritol kinase
MICACDTFKRATGKSAQAGIIKRKLKTPSLRVSVPAKVNLWLEVIRKRDDGYHELSSLMLPIGIYDWLELESHDGDGISLQCDDPAVPCDASNLAWRAAEAFFDTIGSESGMHIRISKNIPVAAGLGGGSADAAAVLLALNQMFEGCLPMSQLGSVAQKLGADVPFFLYQNPALARGIGSDLFQVNGLPDYPLVLVKPPLTVSTRWVYQSLRLTRGESRIKLQTFLAHPWRLCEVMENDLESVTLTSYPVLGEIKEWLLQNDALGALMSGSGPTVFGVYRERCQADRIGVLAERRWPECWVAVAQVCWNAAAKTEQRA